MENVTPEEIKEGQKYVKELLSDEKQFNEAFELTFSVYDQNGDGNIEMREYGKFLDDFMSCLNQKTGSFSTVLKNWRQADKNKDGKLSKEEFKEDFYKRLKEFSEQQL